ncbi:hypothetical protein FGU71_04685 [Erythrobacter insulae]|uniref:Uncharacterized protein n=1 Tax=Erythrobacter insulae TaxID=2584124 RepID=A0A547PAU2_9SPHN|nr:hypothetical protein [Erythrobacter insulae]TRD11217.1 hypothetical protein FGU71_04685 [Erythrobacter insulae]
MFAFKKRIADFKASAGDRKTVPDQKTGKPARKHKSPISSMRGFVPATALWGAVLGALSVLVLPTAIILRIAMASGLSGLGSNAAFVIAGIAALIAGGLAMVAASGFKRWQLRDRNFDPASTSAQDGIEPINPIAELGSDSLDAPIEIEPFSISEIPELDAELNEEFEQDWATAEAGASKDQWESPLLLDGGQVSDAADESMDESFAGSDPDTSRFDGQHDRDETKPVELDLAAFAETPGRSGVWIEEPVEPALADEVVAHEIDEQAHFAEPEKPAALSARIAPSAPSALEQLRQAPIGELSMVHMVERFAAALHDHQNAERQRPGSRHSAHADAALAEALKALSLFTDEGFDDDAPASEHSSDALRNSTRDLRDALAKLQTLRGAA